MKPSTVLSLFVAAIVALVYFSGSIAHFLTDWRWFDAIGHGGVFRATVMARVGLGLFTGLVAFAILQGNAALALRGGRGRTLRLSSELAATPVGLWLARVSPLKIATAASGGVAVLIGLGATAFWETFLLFLHGRSFGYVDPVLGHDASFYVFTLPFLQFARGTVLAAIVLAALVTAALYAGRGAVKLDLVEVNGQVTARGVEIEPSARAHLGALLGAWLVTIAMGTWLTRYTLMFDQGGLISGPARAEVLLALPLLGVQSLLTLLAGGAVAYGIARRVNSLWIGGLVTVVLAAVVANLAPDAYHRLVVLPNELEQERPYLEHHIAATRHAFALGAIEERRLTGDAKLTWDDIEENAPTIKNIRLWDHRPLRDTFSQIQEIRTYYNFPSVDNDRYMVDGELRQTMLSPREMSSASLPARARTWVNETMVYTHGYGVALGPVNEVTREGLPTLWVQDLPPAVRYPDDLAIDQPAIYYGESMAREVFVATKSEEFDYPSGEQNAYTTYTGLGGAPVGGMGWRALWAIRLQNSKVLLTTDITPESRVLLYRRITERVSRIAPFLILDNDPYMVIADGRLVWVLDAYTATSRFPYAQRIARVSYMRNSVKVTVDAYDGTVTFYEMDPADPIIQAWGSAFPDLLTPATAMPKAIRDHIRYPLDLFTVQSALFATYHMTDPQMFYNREDEWEVPVAGGMTMSPYYTVMKVPGEQTEEFIVMLPFVPRNKPNLAAWMVARSDGDNYGEVIVYRFPKDKMIYGPNMIVARFNQDDSIAEKLSLWNQQGSSVELGTLLVIPVEESLIYVQPLYLRASTGSIPELKRVLVGYENQIAMEDTLDLALQRLFGARAAPPPADRGDRPPPVDPTAPTAAPPEGRAEARAAQANARRTEAAARADWQTFGRELDALGKAIAELTPRDGADALPVDAPPADAPPVEEPDAP